MTSGISTSGSTASVSSIDSPEHNFHLTGPGGTDYSTGVAEQDLDEIRPFTLPAEGVYFFRCDAHPALMYGSITVHDPGGGPPPPPPPGPPPPGPAAACSTASSWPACTA